MNISEERLAELLRNAQEKHHVYEQELGHADEDWAKWYAAYIARCLKESA